jgi:hypothetical protein
MVTVTLPHLIDTVQPQGETGWHAVGMKLCFSAEISLGYRLASRWK